MFRVGLFEIYFRQHGKDQVAYYLAIDAFLITRYYYVVLSGGLKEGFYSEEIGTAICACLVFGAKSVCDR